MIKVFQKILQKFRGKKISQFSSRERILAIVGVGIFLVMTLDRIVLGPLLRQTHKTRQEIQSLERILRNHYQILQRKDSVLADLKRHEGYLTPGGSPETEVARFLKEVEAVAQKSQVSLADIKSLPPVGNALYDQYVLGLNCEATLKQWLEFVYLLEHSSSLFEVESGTLTLKEKDVDLLKGKLRIRRIVMRPPAAKT